MGAVGVRSTPVRGVASRLTFSQSLTRSLAVDLAPIRVNAVCPGMVQTEMWDSMLDAEARSAMFATGAKSLLTGRVGQPEDIAQ